MRRKYLIARIIEQSIVVMLCALLLVEKWDDPWIAFVQWGLYAVVLVVAHAASVGMVWCFDRMEVILKRRCRSAWRLHAMRRVPMMTESQE